MGAAAPIIIGIGGVSGAAYGIRLLEVLQSGGIRAHLDRKARAEARTGAFDPLRTLSANTLGSDEVQPQDENTENSDQRGRYRGCKPACPLGLDHPVRCAPVEPRAQQDQRKFDAERYQRISP